MQPVPQTTKRLCQISAQFRVGLALACVTEIVLPRSSCCPQASHLCVASRYLTAVSPELPAAVKKVRGGCWSLWVLHRPFLL